MGGWGGGGAGLLLYVPIMACVDPEVLSEGFNFDRVFFFCLCKLLRRSKFYYKRGYHLPVRETPFKWHFTGMPMMARGGGGGGGGGGGEGGSGPNVPPLDPHMYGQVWMVSSPNHTFLPGQA